MWKTPCTTTTPGLKTSGHSQFVAAVGTTGAVRIGLCPYRLNGPIAHDGKAAARAFAASLEVVVALLRVKAFAVALLWSIDTVMMLMTTATEATAAPRYVRGERFLGVECFLAVMRSSIATGQ